MCSAQCVCVCVYMLTVAVAEALHTLVYLLCADKHAVWHCVVFASCCSVYCDRVLQQWFLCVSLCPSESECLVVCGVDWKG